MYSDVLKRAVKPVTSQSTLFILLFVNIHKCIHEHWQTNHWLLGLRTGRPVDNGPQDGDNSAWVVWVERESGDKKDKPGSPTFPFLQATQAE